MPSFISTIWIKHFVAVDTQGVNHVNLLYQNSRLLGMKFCWTLCSNTAASKITAHITRQFFCVIVLPFQYSDYWQLQGIYTYCILCRCKRFKGVAKCNMQLTYMQRDGCTTVYVTYQSLLSDKLCQFNVRVATIPEVNEHVRVQFVGWKSKFWGSSTFGRQSPPAPLVQMPLC